MFWLGFEGGVLFWFFEGVGLRGEFINGFVFFLCAIKEVVGRE